METREQNVAYCSTHANVIYGHATKQTEKRTPSESRGTAQYCHEQTIRKRPFGLHADADVAPNPRGVCCLC